MFESLPAEPGQLTLLYRASTPDDVVFRTELDTIAATRGATVHYLDIADRDAYVCGPEGMTAAARTVLRACGVPANHIHREEFAFSS